jgi:hypothetical protein
VVQESEVDIAAGLEALTLRASSIGKRFSRASAHFRPGALRGRSVVGRWRVTLKG